jgi:hypothetical protein
MKIGEMCTREVTFPYDLVKAIASEQSREAQLRM